VTTGAGPTGTGTERTRAVDELTSLLLPVWRAITRRLPEIVAGIAVLVTVLAVLAVAGAAVNDRAIAANPAVSEAEVLEGSTFARTLVRFTVANGEAVVPEGGLFYPRGLQVGESVAVEYDVTDPELVRVAGRSALDGVLPLLGGVAVVWAGLLPLSLWLRRRRAAKQAQAR
jgi:hypothetical protein